MPGFALVEETHEKAGEVTVAVAVAALIDRRVDAFEDDLGEFVFGDGDVEMRGGGLAQKAEAAMDVEIAAAGGDQVRLAGPETAIGEGVDDLGMPAVGEEFGTFVFRHEVGGAGEGVEGGHDGMTNDE